jgi:hypothetical protein
MTNKTELLPCPFCGAEANPTDGMFGSVINCNHLYTCPLDGHEELAAAVSEWNARATTSKKTEMESEYSALTYKDLAERLAHYLSSALVSAQYSMTDETMHDALGLCDQVTRRKAAPAEDVRAVGEEPVGYASKTQLKRMAEGYTETLNLCARKSDLIEGVALYRHPAKLPDRKPVVRGLDSESNSQNKGWNACLDAVEELNK